MIMEDSKNFNIGRKPKILMETKGTHDHQNIGGF